MQAFGIERVQYGPSATLAVDVAVYDPGILTMATLYGLDPVGLSGYPLSFTGSQIQVSLTQSTSFTTPVVTAIAGRW